MTKTIKRLLPLLAILAFACSVPLLSSCGTVTSASYGHEDEAFVIVSSHGEMANRKLAILIDGKEAGIVKVIKEKVADRKAQRVRIRPGKRTVILLDKNGTEVYKSDIYISVGSTRKIVLQ